MTTPITRRDALAVLAAGLATPAFADSLADPLTIIVMDPLAAPLSCPCVKGYAQRDYDKLAARLQKDLGRVVKVHFAESLTDALKKKSDGKADLIIGKESVVRAEAKANKIPAVPVASLSGKDGKTTMTGLFVVATADPAISPGDLKGYRIIFGAPEADEKYTAALTVLSDAGVKVGDKRESCGSCSEGAVAVIEAHKSGSRTATVISSYAQPLLEGCGTIKKGDLRVVGETAPVPFIVAFASEKLPAADREAITKSLLSVGKDKDLCTALETKEGFVPVSTGETKKK
jgi:ABC-type phosphate/phosphonate transport system substrate-binding protein